MEKTRRLADDIIRFISDFTPVLESSTVNFYTSNMWDHNLDCEFARQLLQLTDAELTRFPNGRIWLHNEHAAMDGKFPLLRKFVKQMLTNRLDTLALPVDCVTEIRVEEEGCSNKGLNERKSELDARRSGQEQVEESLKAAVSQEQEWKENTELTKRIMGKKKSHEVALMAQKCAYMLSTTGIKQVVDIGSGKGYLGQFLSMQYGINVISVDSSETNTNGALKRTNRLSKQWRGIVKNVKQTRKDSDAESACNTHDRRIGGRGKRGSEESPQNKDGTDRCRADSIGDGSGVHLIAGKVDETTLSEETAESARNIHDCRIAGRGKRGSEETPQNKDDTDRSPVHSTENGSGGRVIANGVNEIIISERTASLSSSAASISTPVRSSSLQDGVSQSVDNSSSAMPPSSLPSSVPITSSTSSSTSSSSMSTSLSTSVSNCQQSGNPSSFSTSSFASSSSSSTSSKTSLFSLSPSPLVTSVSASSSSSPPATDPRLSSPLSKSSMSVSNSLPKTSPPPPHSSHLHSPPVSLTQRASSLPQEDEQMASQTDIKISNDSILGPKRDSFVADDTPAPKTEVVGKGGEKGNASAGFASVTGYIDEDTEIGDLLPCDENARHFDLTQPFMMVGLHTCGDLAPSMLRIFHSNPSMHCLCNVGCCYHHITEEFARSDEWDREHPGVKMGSSYGFPMSAYLRAKKVALGRGARMTACMAADRIASETTVDVKGLFYRAVLQVICRDHFSIPTRKQIIGKLAPKCKSFLEYTRRALRKLKMEDSKISDDEISAYEAKYRPYYKHLAANNQLRAALAPSIEALILLDRLLYLQEQPNIKTASIVRLFDPVTSPRCYGIMAVKATGC